TRADLIFAETVDRVAEIEENAEAGPGDSTTFVADFLGRTRSDIARRKVSEGRIFPLQIVIAVLFGDIGCRHLAFPDLPGNGLVLRHPDSSIVPQRLGHESQLALVIAADRNAGRVNLRVTGIREIRSFFVSAERGHHV